MRYVISKDLDFNGNGLIAYYDTELGLILEDGDYRSWGEIYRGEYKGDRTPYMNHIKAYHEHVYNKIVKFFKNHPEYAIHAEPDFEYLNMWIDWDALEDEEQRMLHKLLRKSHMAYLKHNDSEVINESNE